MSIYTLLRRGWAGLPLFLLAFSLNAAPLSIKVGNVGAWVEVAATPQAREQGMMYRKTLAPDGGMLFVFPRLRQLRMWMRNTPISLDVGFFDPSGRLINVLTMLPDNGKRIHTSSAPALYALEMNAGWFRRHGLMAGARLMLPYPIKVE